MPDLTALLHFCQTIFSGQKGYVLSLLICEFLYSVSCEPRKYPRIRPSWVIVLAGIAIYLTVGFYMPLLPLGDMSITLTTLLIFFISIALQWAVLDITAWRALFNCTAAYLTQNLALNVYEILAYYAHTSGWGSVLLEIGCKCLVYIGCYFLFAKKSQNRELNLSKVVLVQLLLTGIFISNFLFSFISNQNPNLPPLKIPLALCCLLALQTQFGTFHDSNLNREKEILEQLLYREQKQHQLMQETIDIINIKSHDLKKQVSLLRQSLGTESDGLIREVENAVASYNSLVNTGNKNLDLIISEEKLICEKHGIPFDVMADGEAVSFIQPVDLYSLIGNALRNAVENSLKENEKHRSISMDIHTVNGYVCIEITNYCTQKIEFANGFPITSKADTKFHGFGIQSMKYVVEKYGGNMVIHYQNNIFLVKVIFPVNQNTIKQ